MTIQHKNIPEAQQHEPKGVSTAASGESYVANGSGSGAWTDLLATLNNRNLIALHSAIPDISSSPSTTNCAVFAIPRAGKVIGLYITSRLNFTSSDNLITAEKLTAGATLGSGTAFNGGSTIITMEHSQGDFYSNFGLVTTNNSVSVGDCVAVKSNGAGVTSSEAPIVLLLDVSS